MPDIESQLRRYGDAVESTYGRPDLSDSPVSPQEQQSSERRRYAPLLAVAAALVAVVGVWAVWNRTAEVLTPVATDSTAIGNEDEKENDGGDEVDGELEVGHPQLLPSPDSWVLTSATLADHVAVGVDSSDVLAFEHADGRLSILAISPLSEDRPILADAEVERQYNRAVMWWSEDDRQLALMTFDADDEQLRSDAEQLRRSGDSYVLPGAVILTGSDGDTPPAGQQSTLVFSVMSDGEPDKTSSIEQTTAPGTIEQLFRTLFEASDLGTMNRSEVDGRTTYLVTSNFDAYGLAYIDGRIVTWQGSTAAVDLAGFVSSLQPVAVDELGAAIDGAERLRLDAIDQALAANPPDRTDAAYLPRFTLDTPWQLGIVYDESLWTAEQRAEYRVTEDAMIAQSQGQVETGRIWFQFFAASDQPDEGLVILEAREATLSPATITGGSPTDRPITVLGYQGILGEFDGFRLISARKGSTSLEIRSGRLTADELVAFAERLIDRSGDGLTGFDLSDDEFTTVAEGAAPPASDEPPTSVEIRRYNQLWTLDGMQVRMSVSEIVEPEPDADVWPPTEFEEARQSALGQRPPSQVQGTPFISRSGFGGEQLSWLNESAGVLITIDGDPEYTRRAAESLRTVSETEWQELAQPAAFSFEDAISEFRDS